MSKKKPAKPQSNKPRFVADLPYLGPLAEFRKTAQSFADLLPYGIKLDDRTILNKDGSLLVSFAYEAEDLASASRLTLAQAAERINAAIIGLGDGWMLHFHSTRRPAVGYPGRSMFPDATSKIIDEVRRVQFEEAGNHYVNDFVVDLTYLPPPDTVKRLESMMVVGDEKQSADAALADTLAHFDEKLRMFVNLVENDIHLTPLKVEIAENDAGEFEVDKQIGHLVQCACARQIAPRRIDAATDVSALVSCKPLRTGLRPALGNDLVAVLVVREMGSESYPGMFDFLNTLPNEYRVSWRYIGVEREKAIKTISIDKNRWFSKRKSAMQHLKNTDGPHQNTHAMSMADDANAALNDIQAGVANYGYFTMSIVFWEPIGERKEIDAWKILQGRVETVAAELHQRGCQTFFERENAVEAFLGTLPGVGYAQLKKWMLSSRNLADYIPLTGVWTGSMTNPCSYYPEGSPPLAYVSTNGSTPLALNVHVNEVGHFTVAGGTGSGKSVLLGFLLAQHRRYPGARQIVMDVGRSQYVLAKAVGGVSYDVGNDRSLRFCPLAYIDKSNTELRWATDWVASLLRAQGLDVSRRLPELMKVIVLLRNQGPPYSLTRLRAQAFLLPEERDALGAYCLGGLYDIFDGEYDREETASFIHYELGAIAEASPALRTPLISLLFHRIRRMWDGTPTMIVAEEVWTFLDDEQSREEIKDWLKTARKFNVAVGFATQSVVDYTDSPIASTIINACLTRFFLSNPEAKTESQMPGYKKFNLTDWQITLISRLRPRREYFLMSPNGRRAFDMGLTPIELAFIGVSSVETVKHLAKIIEQQEARVRRGGDLSNETPWQATWLESYIKGPAKDEWVDYWMSMWRENGGWNNVSESRMNEQAALLRMLGRGDDERPLAM
jgi:type IV secretion system protein VirB4